jgi:hypothetical protein
MEWEHYDPDLHGPVKSGGGCWRALAYPLLILIAIIALFGGKHSILGTLLPQSGLGTLLPQSVIWILVYLALALFVVLTFAGWLWQRRHRR